MEADSLLMKITFALPNYRSMPSGGYHVHYTYANLLQARGHDVTILFPRKVFGGAGIKDRVKAPLWKFKTRLRNRPLVTSIKLDHRIKTKLVSDLTEQNLPDADILIATAWPTAESLAVASPRCGKKFYIVYDYEFLMTAPAEHFIRIKQTYTMGFCNVATSEIVEDVITGAGGKITANIPCGLDFEAFGLDIAPEKRAPLTLGFPIRHGSYKGAGDAIATANQLKEKYGKKLSITAFGSEYIDIPSSINWLQYPSQIELRNFYNQHSVFLLPSRYEGFGLPALEAMACGAALVTADNGGHRNYAFHEKTALVVPVKRPDLMAEAIDRLFNSDSLRLRLAHAGHDHVQQYTWTTAVDKLEKALIEAAG